MRKTTLDLDTLTVETFEPGSGGTVAPASTTVDASLQWCGTTSGAGQLCLYECQPNSYPLCL